MQECRLMDESPQILYRNYRNLKLDIATESGNFEFNCEFVCPQLVPGNGGILSSGSAHFTPVRHRNGVRGSHDGRNLHKT